MSKTKPTGTGETAEGEMNEKFESKAQQKLFFAKCGDGKTKEQKKWCKLRDEFARSTTKKDYKKMPEKLHPEKTVKYKKKRKNIVEVDFGQHFGFSSEPDLADLGILTRTRGIITRGGIMPYRRKICSIYHSLYLFPCCSCW